MRATTVMMTLFVLVLTAAVFAGPPINYIYMSDLGDMDEGRFSEAYIGGAQGADSNTVHALSWNGSDLGLNWKVSCPLLAGPPVLLEDTATPNGGTGFMKWRTEYTGGKFWLDGSGPWATPPDPYYDGTITYYEHKTTIYFEDWVQVGYVTTATMKGYFDLYGESCIDLTIANAASIGMGGIPPAGYPVLKDGTGGTCSDADPGVVGEWGTVTDIVMIITGCATAVEGKSWGAIKSLYR